MQVVTKQWLLARMYEPDMVIADCRFLLSDPGAGRRAYAEGYIPGAVYFDLEADLSGTVGVHGGRHPLPDVEQLAGKLSAAGIDASVRVVAYDDQGGAMASRLCWLLAFLGHKQVYLLGEGFTAWQEAGYPVSASAPPVRVPKRFVAVPQLHMLADLEEVQQASATGEALLLDAREPARYAGLQEPIDKVAGHIPGAVNAFWRHNLTPEGAWKSREALAELYADLPKERDIIVYCGSGVTACPNVLALHSLGFERVKLYAGSWSDWISYSENPVAVGGE